MAADRYSHGHHESVLRSHTWRTAENSAGFLLPHLRPGQDLLDVGCGPGTITVDLATAVAPGRVTGIDLSTDVIEGARAQLADGPDNLSFEVDDVYDLSFSDASFDVVYAHQVLQHLSDPVAALRQMRRVLRPGGLLTVRDSDYGAFTWWPADPRLDRWNEVYHALTRRNGANADAGRQLHTWVAEAGFDDGVMSTSTWTFRTPEERRWWGDLWADRVRRSEFARQTLEDGLATPAELDEFADAFLRWADDDQGLFILVHGEVLAHR